MSVSRVFVSYSHKDKRYLDRMMVHLSPLIRDGLDVWSDKDIKVGDKWQEKIEAALADADAAILLVSADFLASEFIATNELPPILSKAELDGTKVMPVVLKACSFFDSPLSQFQAVPDPKFPLASLNNAKQEEVWQRVASDLRVIQPKQTAAKDEIDVSNTTQETASKESTRGISVSDTELWDYFRMELAKPRMLEHYHVYLHDNILQIGVALDPVVTLSSHPWGQALIDYMRKLLQRCGWSGEGRLKLVWLPPEVGNETMSDLTYYLEGIWVWYVNDGGWNSWFASPVTLQGHWARKVEIPPPSDDIPF